MSREKTISQEIDELKSDIAVLERVGRSGGYASGYAIDPLLGQMRYRLQKLEALKEKATDMHTEAKQTLEMWEEYSNQDGDLRSVVKYVRSLEQQIQSLKKEAKNGL